MKKVKDDFISKEQRDFKWKLGSVIASSLSGFIVGFIIAVIIFVALFDLTWKFDSLFLP